LSYAIELDGITKTFTRHGAAVEILREVDVAVSPGEIVWLRGVSGAGKSTLLSVAGLLSEPDSGRVRINGREATGIGRRKAATLRAEELGFVFQDHSLFGHLSSIENVMLPSLENPRKARAKAYGLLEQFGLRDRADFRVHRLSGGEQKRVAIARALINDPAVILADEPTAGLDAGAIQEVLEQFRRAADSGRTVVIASHDDVVASVGRRSMTLSGGVLQPEEREGADGINR
jgi:putative ABC transport system ATP-binding protein